MRNCLTIIVLKQTVCDHDHVLVYCLANLFITTIKLTTMYVIRAN